MHFKPPASLLSGPQLWLLHLAAGPHSSSLWKFPLGGFGKTASSSLPPLPLHLLRPQREPHCPHPGFSCDQGKYYLALLMFNAPTPSLATPQPGSLPKAEAAGRGQRGRAWSVGEMAELTDDGECVCVCACACVYVKQEVLGPSLGGVNRTPSSISWHPCLPEHPAPLSRTVRASLLSKKICF